MFDCNSIHAILDQTGGGADALFGPLSSVLTDAQFCGGGSP
jgi:hypothetical protein